MADDTRRGGSGPLRAGMAQTERLRFLLAAAVAGVYFSLVLVMALLPGPLAATLREGGFFSFGMLAALAMIMLVFAVMCAFVWWIDGRPAGGS
jgi:uncharacterized membrane protein (DUF485 family)